MRTWSIILLVLLQACASRDSTPSLVNIENYKNIEKCWKREGEFQSFVVVHEAGGKFFPYYISPWCDVSAEYYPKGLGFIPHIKALKFTEDRGVLRRAALFNGELQSTTPVHVSLPEREDPIYIYIGSVDRLENNGFVYYQVSNPKLFRRIKINLGSFIEMLPADRLKMFRDSLA